MIVTEGLNPHFTSEEQFLAACTALRQNFHLSTSNFQLFFYGAGCGLPAQRRKVAAWLTKAFGTSDIHVETDMLAACRATAGDQPALVGILGTGSNACYYDGRQIAYQAPSTGYILGDEGSANHVGRRLLQDYLSGCMPRNVSSRFHDAYPMTREEFLDAVYHQPNANRFLASLARFAVEHINDDYCSSEILFSLEEWYNYQLDHLLKISHCMALYLVGGFAARIKTLIEPVAKNHGLEIKGVLADPIEGLRQYHIKKI
jgi:N-acetylglucosamine kinase-like BadF-type ATPase